MAKIQTFLCQADGTVLTPMIAMLLWERGEILFGSRCPSCIKRGDRSTSFTRTNIDEDAVQSLLTPSILVCEETK